MSPKRVYIIAEAGVNHNGSLDMAFKLIEKAKECGADCVKFQTFKAEQIVTATSPKANYQLQVTDAQESQFDMLKKLELQKEDFKKLKDYCAKVGIDFMSTPYNFEDADLLNDIGVTAFKIASGQVAELPFLKYVAAFKKKMIVSTGMATMQEVRDAADTIRGAGNNDLVILQCNTDYPSKITDTNLLAMCTMRDELKVAVGYSCHVANNYACYAAVALGAEMIEKHFTLDKNLPGPDHSSSLEPSEFKELVEGIRNVEQALGTGIKTPSESEKKNTYGMRRSLVAKTDLKAGTVLQKEHIAFKRPMNGLSPNLYEQVLGKRLKTDLAKDKPFSREVIDL
jgi:N-acetylneuraminate synthase/N,N'-diacetyllegionaminate synthase